MLLHTTRTSHLPQCGLLKVVFCSSVACSIVCQCHVAKIAMGHCIFKPTPPPIEDIHFLVPSPLEFPHFLSEFFASPVEFPQIFIEF